MNKYPYEDSYLPDYTDLEFKFSVIDPDPLTISINGIYRNGEQFDEYTEQILLDNLENQVLQEITTKLKVMGCEA